MITAISHEREKFRTARGSGGLWRGGQVEDWAAGTSVHADPLASQPLPVSPIPIPAQLLSSVCASMCVHFICVRFNRDRHSVTSAGVGTGDVAGNANGLATNATATLVIGLLCRDVGLLKLAHLAAAILSGETAECLAATDLRASVDLLWRDRTAIEDMSVNCKAIIKQGCVVSDGSP